MHGSKVVGPAPSGTGLGAPAGLEPCAGVWAGLGTWERVPFSISELAPDGNVGQGVNRSSEFSREAPNLLTQEKVNMLSGTTKICLGLLCPFVIWRASALGSGNRASILSKVVM